MTITYTIEFWSPKARRYLVGWSGHDRERASIQFHKAYNARHTRRLIKTTRELDLKAKGRKEWSL